MTDIGYSQPGFWKCHDGEMGFKKSKLNKDFLHFLGQIFGIFDDFSKHRTAKTSKYHEIYQKM